MSGDRFNNDLEKAKNANSEVRRAVREGNLEIGMDAVQKVQTVLTHLDRYEEGLMERVERDHNELETAVQDFRKELDMGKDELHKMEETISRWNRVTLYLDFLEDTIVEMDEKRKEARERAAASSDSEDGDDESGSPDIPDELEISIPNLWQGKEPFTMAGLDITDISSNTYGVYHVEKDLRFIVQKSLGPMAGELEEEENLQYEALSNVVDAMEDATKTHRHLLEVKEILSVTEEDDKLLENMEEKDVGTKIKRQIEDTVKGTHSSEDNFDHILDKERELVELIREAHELISEQIDLDEEFLSQMDTELGESKSFSKWLDFRNTGLYSRLSNMGGRSSKLDKELDKMENHFDDIRNILDKARERKKQQETREEKVLSRTENYLQEYSEIMEES